MTLFENFHVSVDSALHRALHAEKPLSWEMKRILVAVIYGGYELFPAKAGGVRVGEVPEHDRSDPTGIPGNPERSRPE